MRNEKPGGHGERSVAVGVLDMALWDALAKAHGVPLWRLLADRYNEGQADPTAWVYAAGGYYYPGKGLSGLQDEMRPYLDRGYSTVKMKVGLVPLDEDLARIEAALDVVGGDGSRLCVDVNGRFSLEEAIRFGHAVAPYGLRWYEEPLDPLDYLEHAALATCYAPPLATGENLFSHQDARNLIRHGGLRPDRDILQFDPALSYGLVEYLRTLDVSPRTAGRGDAACRTAGTSSPSTSRSAVGSAAMRATRTCSRPWAASRTTRRCATAASPCRTFPASASRPSGRSTT